MTENTNASAPAAARDMSALYTPIAIVVAGALIAIGLFFSLGNKGSAQPTADGQVPAKAVNVKDVKTDGEPFIGKADAPLTMAVWTDYQCPFCKAVEVGGIPQIPTEPAFPTIIKKYVDTGKLRIVFKDFPFLGNDSTTGAEYARAIWHLYPDQYFAWRTEMYKSQDEEGDKGFGDARTIKEMIVAQFPTMSTADIDADITANKAKYDAAMAADRSEGAKFGINGTPGFVVGTKLISGAQDLAQFTDAIESQLK